MTKTANKKAIRSLPALRTSLLWFKRETIRQIKRRASDVTSPKLRAIYFDKASKLAKTDLADLRADYLVQRTGEIRSAPLFALAQVVPGLVRL